MDLLITLVVLPLIVRIISTIFEWWWLRHHEED